LIGLEGSLGAGKSTVIEFVKSKLKGEPYEFMVFDVEISGVGPKRFNSTD